MRTDDVSILIPAFGPAHLLDACLVAITATAHPDPPKEVKVWDNGVDHEPFVNGSADHQSRLVDQVLAQRPEAESVLHGVWNFGFAGGCNRVTQGANGDILLFLNCDTEVQPGWLSALVTAFDDPDVAIAGSRLVRDDGVLHHAGIVVNVDDFAWALEIADDLPTREVDAVTGACFAIRREVFEELGGFDEQYFMCFEDVDLCLRARQAGYKVQYVRESLVMHHKQATGSERWAKAYHNILHFQEKWKNAEVPLLTSAEERDRYAKAKTPARA